MPIYYPKDDFDDFYIEIVPEESGVFALWDTDEVIFYGYTTGSLREELYKHKRGMYGDCTAGAVYYNYELTMFPDYRCRDLLREFEAEHGRLPRCNQS